jgi:hypothetical protein
MVQNQGNNGFVREFLNSGARVLLTAGAGVLVDGVVRNSEVCYRDRRNKSSTG